MREGEARTKIQPVYLHRIRIIGVTGAGKSSLARELGDILARPPISLDELFWGPDWTAVPLEQFLRDVARLAEQGTWIIEGNYSRTDPFLMPGASLLIALDYPFRTVFPRLLKRTLRRALCREPLFAGNRETFARAFLSPDSILLWQLRTFFLLRRRIRKMAENETAEQPVLVFRKSADTERWLRELRGAELIAGRYFERCP